MTTTLDLLRGFNDTMNASENEPTLDRLELFKSQVLTLVQHAHNLENERDEALLQLHKEKEALQVANNEGQQLYADYDSLSRKFELLEKENDALRNNVIKLMQELNTAEITICRLQG